MIIKGITLHNFGIYANTNTFDFDSDKPVILIAGMNGRGKTTLLESILLALYGKNSFAFLESNLSYGKYLKKFVNRNDGTFKTYIEISFYLGTRSEENLLSIRREWGANSASDKVMVRKNGIVDKFLSDGWAMYIEEILPSAVSNFFFFDGEKISNLAMEQTGDQMRGSIKTLLGIDVLERVEKDLKKILQSKNKKISSDINLSEINALEKKLESLADEEKEIQQNINKLNSHINSDEIRLAELEGKFLAQGGNLGESKKELLSKKDRYNRELSVINEQIMERISAEAPLIMVCSLLEQILDASEAEREQNLNEATYQRMQQLLNAFTLSDEVDKKTINTLSDFIKSNIEQAKQNGEIVYNLSENGHTQAQMLTSSLLRNQAEHLKSLQMKRKTLQDKINETENYLMVEVNENETTNMYMQIKDLSLKLGEHSAKMVELENALAKISAEIIATDKARNKIIENSILDLESKDDVDRIMLYSNKGIEVIQEYKLRLQSHKAVQLAKVVTDCYLQITNKKSLISRVTIDEVTLDFQYWNADDETIPWNIMSAGEKQLMVTAILWALTKCSHNRLPVVIDTPLARLDSNHRKLMVKNYFPYASKQTIILSTDSEIDEQYYNILKPFIGKEYSLEYDDKKQSTTVHQGFFGGENS